MSHTAATMGAKAGIINQATGEQPTRCKNQRSCASHLPTFMSCRGTPGHAMEMQIPLRGTDAWHIYTVQNIARQMCMLIRKQQLLKQSFTGPLIILCCAKHPLTHRFV